VNAAEIVIVAYSFNLKLTFTDRDFEGLDQTDPIEPRQGNGDLPQMPFMKPRSGNPAIDKGVDVGFPFKGRAPDLGAFE